MGLVKSRSEVARMFVERRLLSSILCVAVVAAVSGCSPSSGSAGDSGSIPVSPSPSASVPSDDSDLPFPIFAYMPTPDERVVVEQARHLVESACASSFGISWTAPPLPAAKGVDHNTERLWGVMTMADAQQYGYHFNPDMGMSTTQQAPPTQQTTSAAENLVLYGALGHPLLPNTTPPTSSPGEVEGKPVPPSGCYGQSNQELYGTPGPIGNPTLTAAEIWFHGGSAAQSDPRVQALDQQWSVCMAQKGYHYSDPFAALAGGWGSPDSGVPSQREIQAAVADVSCKTSTNYIPAADAVMTSIDQQLMASKMSVLQDGEKQWEKIVTRARAIVAATSTQQPTD